jgi:nucleoside phosphorylase
MNDEFTPYEDSMSRLLEELVGDQQVYQEALLLQIRLQRVIAQARRYGREPAQNAELNRVLDLLIELSLRTTGKSFNEWHRPFKHKEQFSTINMEQAREVLSSAAATTPPKQQAEMNKLSLSQEQSHFRPSRAFDVGIVIALQEEFDVFFPTIEQVYSTELDPGSGQYFFVFHTPDTDGVSRYRCVATLLGGMGATNAALITESMVRLYHPQTTIMLGIAAGIHDDVRIGDVIVADSVDSYIDRGKIKSGASHQDDIAISFSSQVYQCSADLLQHLQTFKYIHAQAYQQWCQSGAHLLFKQLDKPAREELKASGLVRLPITYSVGPLASGPLVVASSAFKQQLQHRNRSFLGVEMEAGGMMAALHKIIDSKRSLVLRGVSDFGDERKQAMDEIYGRVLRRFAMHNTVQLFWQLLGVGVLPHDK